MSPPTFARPPHAITPEGALSQFKIAVSDEELQNLKTLLKILPIARPNWENSGQTDRKFGISRQWLVDAVDHWQNKYDWRKREATMNSVPHFKVNVKDDDGQSYDVHFAGLFSENPKAVPVLLAHGWPGSFIEFLPILLKLREKYASSPDKLPYHVIVPSLIGFGFSSPPPSNKDFMVADNARLFHKLMVTLGFGKTGYVTQGGDLGAPIVMAMTAMYPEAKATHVNLFIAPPAPDPSLPAPEESEVFTLERTKTFRTTGMAYAMTHATRPSTVGLALASSPIALLAWIGDKMVEWSDPKTTPSLEHILDNISIYWFSGCYPTSIWCYRGLLNPEFMKSGGFDLQGKPMGFSWFPYEISMPQRVVIKDSGKVAHYYEHDKGGHFAALEQPEVLWGDFVDFISKVWKD